MRDEDNKFYINWGTFTQVYNYPGDYSYFTHEEEGPVTDFTEANQLIERIKNGIRDQNL